MTTITGIMEWVLENIAGFAIVIFEFIGVAIIIWSGITGFIKWLKHAGDTGVYLARGLAMGLEFKMGSEILRTVVVREWKEIGIVAGIIALRAALTFLLHWEIKEEEKAADIRNKDSLFIDDICGFRSAHIKVDKGITNNGNESNCSYQKRFSNEIWNSPSERQNTGIKGGYYF